MSERNIRIFISSPGDVKKERTNAKAVVEQLQRRFAGRLKLTALLWEDLPLRADMSFQQGIDIVLSERGVDIAVFILWSRLGSPTGRLMNVSGEREYRSGTEREWHLMLQAREQCENNGLPVRPELLVYTRDDEAAFLELQRGKPIKKKQKVVDDKAELEAFIQEQFVDAKSGVNIRAYHKFDQPTTFTMRLRAHLTDLLEELCGESVEINWDVSQNGPPFLGLEAFEFKHSQVFFGREDEIVTIRSHLKHQACLGCAFVLISGPSGSGKSSLARAGVLPDICQHELDTTILGWRWLAVRPSELGADLLDGLLQKLCADHVLPELKQWSKDLEIPQQRSGLPGWMTRLGLRIKDALAGASLRARAAEEGTRLIILIDQLEELFSQATGAPEAIHSFFEVIESLARLHFVWVVATIRSDFSQECQAVPALVRMKKGYGHFDLQPPEPDGLLRMITCPARQAGLRFEQENERSLADAILREATHQAELLPLIGHLLRDLYEHQAADRLLTWERYRSLGGLSGALQKHCETNYLGLSAEAQAALGRVVSQLVSISGDNLNTAVRRTIPVSTFAGDKPAIEFIERLVAARLISTGVDSQGNGLVSVAHEAVLRSWPLVIQWIDENLEQLRIRKRLEQAESRWREQKDDSLLLQRGIPLHEAQRLCKLNPGLLTAETKEYVERSVVVEAARVARQKKIWVLAVSIVVFVGIVAAWFVQQSLTRSRVQGLVDSLVRAEPVKIPEIIQKLSLYQPIADTYLKPLLATDAGNPDERRSLLHVRMAAVANDSTIVDPLLKELLTGRSAYTLPIRHVLKPRAGELLDRLKKVLRDEEIESQQRFRAALALVDYLPESGADFWSEADLKLIARELVKENPEWQLVLRPALLPIQTKLFPELEVIFKSTTAKEGERLSAANAFEYYARDDVTRLAGLLVDATPGQYRVLYPWVEAGKNAAVVEQLATIVKQLPPDDMGSVERVYFGQRRANAAVTLLNMGERENVLPVFQMTDDPEALTQFIYRFRPRGIAIEPLLELFDLVSDAAQDRYPVNSRYALILSLGEFSLTQVPKVRRDSLVEKIAHWYANDPSSGVHGAASWLLRRWGQTDIATKIDQTPVAYSPDREWFTLAIEVTPTLPVGQAAAEEAKASQPAEKQPVKTVFYYTFIVFPAGEYTIGSFYDERNRMNDEMRHTVQLTQPFAICDRETTYAELIAFDYNFESHRQYINAQLTSAGSCANWYDSVFYCHWLGVQMGLTEGDAYPTTESLDEEEYTHETKKNSPKDWPLNLDRFRLPTEAEWEVACRLGNRTAFGFGGDPLHLDQYGWYKQNSGEQVHEPRRLRPSMRGLFDMHGNVFEWTLDRYEKYEEKVFGKPKIDLGRVYRGGIWLADAAQCRSSFRRATDPTGEGDPIGCRLALTLPVSSSLAEQEEPKR